MRITNQMKFNKTIADYQRGMADIYKYNNQLSSGVKIQNSYDDANIYSDGMRLDYELTTLKQVSDATSKSVNFSKNSDKTLLEFSKKLELFKVKLTQASNQIHSSTSLGALANELEGIKDHLMNLANTSINGQFLFSGSAVDKKPISTSGDYHGNSEQMKTVGGSKIEIPFNISGDEIFLGTDNDYAKVLTTNVKLSDQTRLDAAENPKYLTEESEIKNLIGLNYVKDKSTINVDHDFKNEHDKSFNEREHLFQDSYFYLQGRKPDGTSFTSRFKMSYDASIKSLLEKIGQEFGNSATDKVVDVTINNHGQINVKDLSKGGNFTDFSLVAATEQASNKADVARIRNRDHQYFNDKDPVTGAFTYPNAKRSLANVSNLKQLEANAANGSVFITDFTKSNFYDNNGAKTNSFDFDRVRFQRTDNKLTGNVSQVVRSTGAFATDETRLSEVAATKKLYESENDKYNINEHRLSIDVVSRSSKHYKIDISFGTLVDPDTAQFTVSEYDPRTGRKLYTKGTYSVMQGDEYHFKKDADGNPELDSNGNKIYTGQETPNKDMTFRQLNDLISMAAADSFPKDPTNLPADYNYYEDYKQSIKSAQAMVEINLNHRGQIQAIDKTNSVTPIEISVYDDSDGVGSFSGDNTKQGEGSIFSFSENNAIAIDEPSVDIFKDLDSMIKAVRSGYYRADSEANDPRNTGVQGALERIDHIMDHINKQKTTIGSYTNLLEDTKNRADIMFVNVSSVKSEVIDTDLGEANLHLMQKMVSYQAMLQATAKINQLRLLNYL